MLGSGNVASYDLDAEFLEFLVVFAVDCGCTSDRRDVL